MARAQGEAPNLEAVNPVQLFPEPCVHQLPVTLPGGAGLAAPGVCHPARPAGGTRVQMWWLGSELVEVC